MTRKRDTPIRGAIDLGFEAVDQITALVARTQARVLERSFARAGAALGVNGVGLHPWAKRLGRGEPVYQTIRLVNQLARMLARAGLATSNADTEMHPTGLDDAISFINGLWGDYLHAQGHALDLGMTFRVGRQTMDLTAGPTTPLKAAPHAVVFIHGLCMHEACWFTAPHGEHDFEAWARQKLNASPLLVRYNTGLHISDNGQALSLLLDQLIGRFPEIERVSLVGHSMGGLVAMSAAHQAERAAWRSRLHTVVCIGSPHLGAPLSRAAHHLAQMLLSIPAAGAEVPGEILANHSAGIQDLRAGYLLEEEWTQGQRVPLGRLPGVATYSIASSVVPTERSWIARLLGDGLVTVPSASAWHEDRTGLFEDGEVLEKVHHIELTTEPRVRQLLEQWLTS